jgi:hypothetical protein
MFILDVNIGSPTKKTVTLEIYDHEDPKIVVDLFSKDNRLNDNKKTKLHKIV